MKRLSVLFVVVLAALSASAAIEVRVCDPVHLRPLGTHEVMLGTQVSLVVYSDANDLWSGGLFIHDEHRGTGTLSSRDAGDPNAPAGRASCLAAAGEGAFVLSWKDSLMSGYDLYTDEFGRDAGNWFVLDYTPLAEGECIIHLYDHSYSFTVPDPNIQLSLFNSPTRDWDGSGVVDLADYAAFASMWMSQECQAPQWCNGADLDRDGAVGLIDVLMFADFWLWGTPNWQYPSTDTAEEPPVLQDPNVFYAVVDPNGFSDVSIPVGQSVRLYLDKTTVGQDVYVFSLEAMISDPNLGWIDNTAFDPNDPYGGGTAEILATPLAGFFDYWGPGYTQEAGIQFLTASFNGPINDGVIASFVYVATAPGTVTLELIDYLESVPSGLTSITLHQYEPEGQVETAVKSTGEIVEMLEGMWEETPELQESIHEDDWTEFIEAVKLSSEIEDVE